MATSRPRGRGIPPGLRDQDPETLRRAVALVRVIRDPALPGLVFLFALVVAGAAVVAGTVLSAASIGFVPLQMPYVVSGGFAGVALIAVGALLAAVQAERRDRVVACHEMQQLVDQLSALVRSAAPSRTERGW